MRSIMKHFTIALILIIVASSCNCLKNKINDKPNQSYAVQRTTVYKTIGDFAHLVPITMNKNRTEIISYPAPSDLIINGKLTTPTQLKKGYLLDNRGVNINTVFLKFTYEDYSKMDKAPSLEELMKNIAERHPFTELINCGPRSQFKDEIKEINRLIDDNFLNCKRADIIPLQIQF